MFLIAANVLEGVADPPPRDVNHVYKRTSMPPAKEIASSGGPLYVIELFALHLQIHALAEHSEASGY